MMHDVGIYKFIFSSNLSVSAASCLLSSSPPIVNFTRAFSSCPLCSCWLASGVVIVSPSASSARWLVKSCCPLL